ncbi:MAG: sulfatase [Planctomycetes bacterium]|nr:sulfatase [Planctomycetota bacterium]
MTLTFPWPRSTKRLRFRHLVPLLLMLTASAAQGQGQKAPEAPRPPNVLFLVVDDLNDWTGPLGGNPASRTPNLDRIAKQGVVFRNAQCAAPACNPSRTAVMTGVHPSVSGLYWNNQDWTKNENYRLKYSLPRTLLRAGSHRVIGAGKIMHGAHIDPRGWNEYWPSFTRSRPRDQVTDFSHNGFPIPGSGFDWGKTGIKFEDCPDTQVANWVIGKIARHRGDKPLFVGCGFYRPHLPFYVPDDYYDAFPLDRILIPVVPDDDLDDVPLAGRAFALTRIHRWVVESGNWAKAVQGYLASVRYVDDLIGKVYDTVQAREDHDDWIIVIWSDHGWHLGEKQTWTKFTLWEESCRSLMLWHGPSRFRAGSVVDDPVGLIDIYPTLADYLRLPSHEMMSGISLRRHLEDPSFERGLPVLTTHGPGNHSLRSKRWRYTRYADGSEELYDHDADPGEWTNLAAREESLPVLRSLRKHLPTGAAVAPSPLKAWVGRLPALYDELCAEMEAAEGPGSRPTEVPSSRPAGAGADESDDDR